MSKNIVDAIIAIIEHDEVRLSNSNNNRNRLHAMGEPLEDYVKDAFAGTFNMDVSTKLRIQSRVFSYGGSKNHPPDAVLRNGDAIEVKKVESIGEIPLNSSYPKSKLHSDDIRITQECREIDGGHWDEKDIIYFVGCARNNTLSSVAMVYGEDYCANRSCYENVLRMVKAGIGTIAMVSEPTNELGHYNAVDPLGITYMRIRGMWGIKHPIRVFDYVYHRRRDCDFELMCIINDDKVQQLDNFDLLLQKAADCRNLNISDIEIKDPNNTVQLKRAKLITYFR